MLDLNELKDYQRLGSIQSFDRNIHAVIVLVKLPRPVNALDHNCVDLHAIYEQLLTNTVLLDPELPAKQAAEEATIRNFFNCKVYLKRIPNQYCPHYYCVPFPWFQVTTPVGRFTVGRRKRVFSIDWSETVVEAQAEALFPDEDVTKVGRLIHAWTEAKAREYVARVMQAAD